MNIVEIAIDVFGWSAVIVLLIHYTLVSNKKKSQTVIPYHLLNLWGITGQ